MFNISANGELSYFRSSNIPSLGSIFDPIHPEHAYRLKSYAAKDVEDGEGNVIGYNVEVAIQIENLGIEKRQGVRRRRADLRRCAAWPSMTK